MYAYYIISMTTMCFYDDCILFEKAAIFFTLLLHSSNLLTVAHMEVKLGMYAYYIISMTITCFHDDSILFEPQEIFFNTTSSLLKLACSAHGGETWCACVLHRFHDDHNNK